MGECEPPTVRAVCAYLDGTRRCGGRGVERYELPLEEACVERSRRRLLSFVVRPVAARARSRKRNPCPAGIADTLSAHEDDIRPALLCAIPIPSKGRSIWRHPNRRSRSTTAERLSRTRAVKSRRTLPVAAPV